MSAYIDFFVRHGDEFFPLGDFSRNSIVYYTVTDCFSVPWEKIIPFTKDNLYAIRAYATKRKERALAHIDSLKACIEDIKGFNNSVEDKLQQIEEYKGEIEEWRQEVDEAVYAENYFYFLIGLIEAARSDVNINKYIYAGIEIGEPTIEDIKE